MFSVRIVTTDHYQATPIPELDVLHSDFRGSDVYKVPVIRVYGATPAGQKTCMHVHGVFPYLYVPYDGTQPWDRYMRLFASSLDKAVNVAQGHPTSNIQHVYKITLVSGISMYGYHDKEQQFLKIYLYNPGIVRKVADLLLGGAVMNQVYQPHESHIPYTLQMFIDYNLYGMNLINAAAVKFRRRREDDNGNIMEVGSEETVGRSTGTPQSPHLSFDDNLQGNPIWDDTTISSDLYVDNERLSTCELEVDVVAADILNRLEVDANVGTNPGLAALWEDEKQRKRDRGESSQLTPPDSQEHENVEITVSDMEFRQRFHEIVLEQQPYMDSQSDTTSEASQYDDQLQTDINPTPAAEVDLHMSQTEGDLSSSQDTVVLEDEEKVAPVISLESIKRVVSLSQSFSESPVEGLPMSQPQRSSQGLAEMLASLAEESSPACSQVAASQIEALEEEDCVLHNTSQQLENDDTSEDAETLEMSQTMWGEEEEEEKEPVPGPSGVGEQGFNWTGLDDTWDDSQLKETNSDENDDEIEETIPQFDGAADEKPAKSKTKKMQEASGSLMPTFNQMGQQQDQGHQSYQQNQGQYQNQSQQMMFEDNSQFMYGNQGNSSVQYNQGYQQPQGYNCNYGMDNSYRNHGAENYDNSRWGQNFQQLQEMSPPQNNMSISWGQNNQGWGGGDNSMSNSSPIQHVPIGEHQSTTDTVLSPLETVNSPVLHSPHSSLQSPLSTRQSPTLQSPSASMHASLPSPQSLATMQPMQPLQSPTATSTNTQLDTSDSRGSQLTPMQSSQMCMGDYSSTNNHGYNNYNQSYYGNQTGGDFNTGTYMNQYNQVTDQQGGGQMPRQNYNHGGYQYNQYHSNHQQLQLHPNQQQWPQQFHGNQSPMPGQPQGRKKQANQNAGGKWTNANKSTTKRCRKTKKTQPLPGTTQVSSGSLKTVPGQVTTKKVKAQPSKDDQTSKPQSTLERLLLGDEDEECLTEQGQRSVSRCSNVSTASSRTSVGPTTPVLPTPNVGPLTSPLSPYEVKGQPQKVADLLTQVKPSSQDLQRRSSMGDNTLDSSQLSNSSLLGSQEDLFIDTTSKSQTPVLSSPAQDMAIANSFSQPSSKTLHSPNLNNQSNIQASTVAAGSQQQGKTSDTFSCLQSLQSLVSSVQKDPHFGVNVHQEGQLGNYPPSGQVQPPQGYQAHGQLSQSHQQVHPSQGHQSQTNPSQSHQSQSHVPQVQPFHKGHHQAQQGQNHQSRSGHPDPHGNIGYQQFSPPQMWNDSQSNMNTYHQQSPSSGHQQFHPYWNRQDRNQMSQGSFSSVSNTSNPPYGMKEYSTPTHGSMKFPGSIRHPSSAQSVGNISPAGRLSPKLGRSLSVIKKRGRPRKYDTPSNVPAPQFPLTPQSPTTPQPRSRSNSVVDKIPIVKSPVSNASYTFSFQVPTPVFKRLKFHKKKPLDSLNSVKFVRMHPMDARRYSLLKIGREIVKTQNLSTLDIEKAVKRIRAQNIGNCTKRQAACSDTGKRTVSDHQKNGPTDISYMHHPGNTLAQDMFGVLPEPRISDKSELSTPCQSPIPNILPSTETTRECDKLEDHVGAGTSPQKQSLKAKLSQNISNLHLKKMLHERMAIKDGNRPCTYTGNQNFSDGYGGRPQPTLSREGQETRGNISTEPKHNTIHEHNSSLPSACMDKLCSSETGQYMCPKDQDDIAQNHKKKDEKKEFKHEIDMKNGMEKSPPVECLKGGLKTPQNSFLSQFQNFLSKGYSSSDADTGNSPSGERKNADKPYKVLEDSKNSPKSDFTANHKNERIIHSAQNNGFPGNNGEHKTVDNMTDLMSGGLNSGGHRSEGQMSKGYMQEGHISQVERPEGNTFRNHTPESQMYGNQRADGYIPERNMTSGHVHPGQMPMGHLQGQMASQMPRGHSPEEFMRGHATGSVPRGHVPGTITRGHVPGTIPRGHVPGTIPKGHVPGNNSTGQYMAKGQMPGSTVSWDHMSGNVTNQMPEDLRGNEINGNGRDDSTNSLPTSVHNLPQNAANTTEINKIEKQNTGNFLGYSDQGGCPSGHKTPLAEKKDFHRAVHPSVTPRPGVREYTNNRNIFEKLLNSKILSDDTDPSVNNFQPEHQREELQGMTANDHVTKYSQSKLHPQKNDFGSWSSAKVTSYGIKRNANFSNIIEQVLMTSVMKDKLDDKLDKKMFQRDRMDGGCLVSTSVGVHPNEGLKVIRRKNLSTKRRFKITPNGHIHNVPAVIDQDREEIQNVILKDVNLTEASNGVLTPITSQTPVAGRSPIRHNYNSVSLENYKLFDSDIISNRNELEAKLKTLRSELELQPSQSVKNYCLAENDLTCPGRIESPISATWSGLSSRTTSRKDSSESSMSAPDTSKTKLKSRKRKMSSLTRGGKQNHRLKGTKGKSTENSGSDMDYTFEKENKELKRTKRKKKKKEVAGIDYIVIGRFKGHRKMAVCLERLEISQDESVNVNDFLVTQQRCLNHSVNHRTSDCSSGKDQDLYESSSCQHSRKGSSDSCEDSLYHSSCQSSPEKNPSLRAEMCDDWSNDSKEQQADIDSDDPKSSKNNRKKKKLTRNQKLQIAFLSKKSRRKKTPGSGKLMNSLSLLHEATIANLNDTRLSYNENTEDFRVRYEDAMFKMSFLSSSDSDKGNTSPPLPVSPEELARDHQGRTRSTSEAQSPVLTASDNSRSPIYSTMQTTLRMKNSSGSDLTPVYQPLMNQVTMCDGDFKPFSSVSLRSPSSQTPAFGLGLENRVNRSFADYHSENSRDCNDESQDSDSTEICSTKNKLKKAVIRLTPLSAADIENFCGKSNEASSSNLERVSSPVYEKQSSESLSEGSNSPPDLGPPNIPKYPKTGPTNDDSRSPPLLLSTSSPNTPQVLKTNQNHVGFGFYDHKSPVSSCSNGSLNVVHSDRFSDISDDEEDLHLQLEVNDDECHDHIINNSDEDRAILSPWLPDSSKVNGVACMSESGSDRDMPSLVKEMITVEPMDNCVCMDGVVRKCVGQNETSPSKESASSSNNSNSNQSLGTNLKNFENRNMDNNTKQSHPSEEYERNFNEGKCRKVLTPDILPPSRKMVQNTATSHGLNSAEIVRAYCSNPEDLPEQPRELGGRVLEVQSTRVKDYNEFSNDTDCEGILTWRNRMMTQDQIILSQSENETLMNRIEKDSKLRYALLGDKSVVISPCNPPPSTNSVKKWICGRKVWKDLKHKEKLLKIEINKKKDDKRHCESPVANLETGFLGNQPCIGKSRTNEDDKMNQTDKTDTFVQHSKLLSETMAQDNMIIDGTKDSTQQDIPRTQFMDEDSFISDNDDEEDDDEVIGPSPPSGLRLSQFPRSRITSSQCKHSPMLCHSTSSTENEVSKNEFVHSPVTLGNAVVHSPMTPATAVVHSPVNPGTASGLPSDILTNTPVHCKQVSRLFNSAFTPITSGSKPSATSTPSEKDRLQGVNTENETPGIFATPKRMPLPRRLSSITQKSLQQALQSSQLQQFATPRDQKGHTSQIDGPTPQNSFGFKVSQDNLKGAKALHEVQNLTVLSLELYAETRGDLRPDPEVDAVKILFYSISNDVDPAKGKTQVTGIIIVDHVSVDVERALRERRNRRTSSRSPSPSPVPSGSNTQRSRSPQSCSSSSSKPSTSRSRSPLPSTSKSPQPSTSKCRSPSPKPSTSRGRKGRARGVVTPPPRRYDSTENIPNTFLQRSGTDLCDLQVTYVRDEEEMFSVFLEDLIGKWDPDILVGYEIQNFSWGYLLQRASHLSIPLCAKLSRIPGEKTGSHFSATKDEYGADHMSEIHVVGRIVLNLWRLLRHEVTLNIYSFENVYYHVLHQRVPQYSFRTLSNWFNHKTHLYRWRLIDYHITRVKGNLQLIDQLDLIGRTSEFARVFGIEFYHVLSRGSQYRVESMMLRLAKPLNYIPVSPSVHQRARMRAPECIALTLEPESRFYADPVVVVDFQSLYPSIMIAHNYCFSTCLGRLNFLEKAHEGSIEFGCTHLNVPPAVLKKMENDITVSPNGVVFVKQHIRKGVISAMVEEILNTRLMVKKAMKAYKNDKALYRMLDARQMGLKLIANVTYGYTGASFSGRMPCVEVADSIVRKARETLERAIKLVEDTPRWGARVVYGDTDSMFIELKGRSKEEAFKIGYEICDAVTAANPKPMKLKFEKVYLPCILQTKKRYVGFSYETPDQKEPIFDAKGIETVRRDACPAVAKILERTIKTLFTTRDVSQVKNYVQTQCRKLMEGKVSLQDLVFAKEYRGMAGYKPGACVPALEISRKCLRQDRRGEPRVGERVPYVIVYGSPGLPLIQLVRAPGDLLTDPSLRLNATYYITKQILPPLNRVFSLMGINVFTWYNEMPKVTRVVPQAAIAPDSKKGTISQFFSVVSCPVCEEQTNQDICIKCARNPQKVAITLNNRIREWDKVYADLTKICNSCMNVQDISQPCVSLDCPILFRRRTAHIDITKGEQLRTVATKVLDF